MYIYTYIIYNYVHNDACVYVYIHVYIYTYVCTHIYICIYMVMLCAFTLLGPREFLTGRRSPGPGRVAPTQAEAGQGCGSHAAQRDI